MPKKESHNLMFLIFLLMVSSITYFIIFKIKTINEGFYDGCGKNKCICSGMSEKVCINTDKAQSLYNDALVTENTIPPKGHSTQQYMPYI